MRREAEGWQDSLMERTVEGEVGEKVCPKCQTRSRDSGYFEGIGVYVLSNKLWIVKIWFFHVMLSNRCFCAGLVKVM